MKTQYPMIPFPLIVKATDGDTEAINQILHHYRYPLSFRGSVPNRSMLPEQGGLLFHQSILNFQCVLIG